MRSDCVIMFTGNIHSDMPCHAEEESRICSVLFACMHVLCGKMWSRSQKVSVCNLRSQRRNSISIIDHKRFCTYAFSLLPLNLCLLIHICLFYCISVFGSLLPRLFPFRFRSFFLIECFPIVSQQICMIYIVSTESNLAPLIIRLT